MALTVRDKNPKDEIPTRNPVNRDSEQERFRTRRVSFFPRRRKNWREIELAVLSSGIFRLRSFWHFDFFPSFKITLPTIFSGEFLCLFSRFAMQSVSTTISETSTSTGRCRCTTRDGRLWKREDRLTSDVFNPSSSISRPCRQQTEPRCIKFGS